MAAEFSSRGVLEATRSARRFERSAALVAKLQPVRVFCVAFRADHLLIAAYALSSSSSALASFRSAVSKPRPAQTLPRCRREALVIELYQPCSRTTVRGHNPGCSQGFGSNLKTGCEHQGKYRPLCWQRGTLLLSSGSSIRVRCAHHNLKASGRRLRAGSFNDRPMAAS